MRKTLIQSFVGCLLAIVIVTSIWGQTPVQGEKRGPRVLILSDKADELPVLAERLADEGYRVGRLAQQDLAQPLDGYAAVIVFVHKPLLTPVEIALIEYARGGGRLVVLHHAIASAKMANPKWLKFLGVSLAPRNAARYPWKVSAGVTFTMVNLAPKHFITNHGVSYDKTIDYSSPDHEELRGSFPAFALVNTEIFHNQRHTDGKSKTILFGYFDQTPAKEGDKSNTPTMEDTAGWYKRTGKGLTFYLQAGHVESDYRNANFMQVILNCLTWSDNPTKTHPQ